MSEKSTDSDDTAEFRLLNIEGYRDLITQVDEHHDTARFVLGTPTERASWATLLEDGYAALDEAIAEVDQGVRVDLDTLCDIAPDEPPGQVHAAFRTEPERDGAVMRFGPFIYPRWVFADDVGDLGGCDPQFAAVGLADAEHVDERHHAVLTPDQFDDLVADIAAQYATERAVVIGGFSTGRSFAMADEDSVQSIDGLTWPAGAFAGSGIGGAGVGTLSSTFLGTLLCDPSLLTADARAFARGEVDRIEASETETATDDRGEQTYHVPLIDPETGDDYDVKVVATSPRNAIQQALEQADGEAYVVQSWAAKHLDLDDPREADDE